MVGHRNLLLVYDPHNCSVIKSENIGVDAEIFVSGFEGMIERAMWIDSELFGLVTDKGFYIFNMNGNYNTPHFTIIWTEEFEYKAVCVEPNTRLVFVLNEIGQLAKSQFRNTRMLQGYIVNSVQTDKNSHILLLLILSFISPSLNSINPVVP